MDTQVITGIIGDKFSFHWSKKKISYMKKERKWQERRYQLQSNTEEKPTEFIKVKVNGTLNDVSSYKLYEDSIDFENSNQQVLD